MDDDLEEKLGMLNGKVDMIKSDVKSLKEVQSEQSKKITEVEVLLSNHINAHELDWRIVGVLVSVTAIVVGVLSGLM